MKKIKKLLCICLSVVLATVCCSCTAGGLKPKTERYTASFLDLFDTASTILAYDTSEEEFHSKYEQFYQKLEEYDHLYDIYNSYDGMNNLYKVNQAAKYGPVKVDKKIIDLLEYGKEVYDLSGGKTNICYGAVLSLWHDSREKAADNPEDASLPDMKELEKASKHTDINDLIIDKENSTVYFADPKLRLDVGAIAKGYAVQQVCSWAEKNLWQSAAISIGGNVYTYGYKNNDGETLWTIGIENPDTSSKEYLNTVKITGLTVTVSGDYQRYFTVDGKRYCHIINPDTLMPAEYVSGVSVICDNSALGDALSTTLFNMSIEEGKKLIENTENVEAVWVDKEYNATYSSGFEQYIAKN